MFAYPKQSHYSRVVPKTKIYTHGKPSKRIKELFATQVAEILWKYKLSPETTNLPARKGVNEIQVFEITLKTPQLDEAVLQVIDKAIPFPLVFQIVHGAQTRFAVAYKRPSEADASKWVLESTFMTPFEPSSRVLEPLPVAVDLAGLYEQIVRRHIPLPPRTGEGIAEHIARFDALQLKQKIRRQLESRLSQEKQFKRKVELNAALRSLYLELETLTHP